MVWRSGIKNYGEKRMVKYLTMCPNCKKKTAHLINIINPRKGYKLRCAECFYSHKRYKKVYTLTEIKDEEVKE